MQQSSQFLVEEVQWDRSQSGHNPRLAAGTRSVTSKKPMESNPKVGLICKAFNTSLLRWQEELEIGLVSSMLCNVPALSPSLTQERRS